MTDLEKMFESYKQELQDYEDLSKIDFLLKYEYNFKDDVIKDYEVYLSDNEGEELLAYDEWIEEYAEEISDELNDKVIEYFSEYGIEQYESKYNSIWDINIAGGGPQIDLRVEDKYEHVMWIGRWGGEYIEEDISQYYDTVYDIYNLDM